MQTMAIKQIHEHFHHCGALIIRKWDDELEYYYIYCPQCDERLNQDDYPELMKEIYKIEHDITREKTLITTVYVPLSKKNNCKHPNTTFLYEDDRAKMNVSRCNDCNQITREKR